jgi:hypothetical protein
MPLLCCDIGLVSELRLTAGCVLMDLASQAVSGTSVYANGLTEETVSDYSNKRSTESNTIKQIKYMKKIQEARRTSKRM